MNTSINGARDNRNRDHQPAVDADDDIELQPLMITNNTNTNPGHDNNGNDGHSDTDVKRAAHRVSGGTSSVANRMTGRRETKDSGNGAAHNSNGNGNGHNHIDVADIESGNGNGDAPHCRICYGDHVQEKLVVPCACSGSMKWIHISCLNRWRLVTLPHAHHYAGHRWPTL